ncbi:C-glycoside deglycosidase beta subunit domain-containing protein [Novosphingobium huizhouense]|uniref:C-glycoside deglycosidase beta subunit domain-containing protein n=1 Tax=Novosphingobium huizhouense TaxID=2866625 RepID=UPI001CD913CE|nr:DUF6379 domain-containing protein [Novosphingobium huizhouense]
MLPVERLIGEEGVCAHPRGIRLAMRLPWYRSLPFSTVEVAAVSLDGVAADLSDAVVEYDGKSWPLAQNGEKVDEFWFVRDSAFLVLPAGEIEAGREVALSLTINISPPYIPGMTRTNTQVATLRVA